MTSNLGIDLELVEHRRPPDVGRYEWQPYAEDGAFNHSWWARLWSLDDRYSLWSVLQGDVEVARIQLDEEVQYDHYADVPDLGSEVMEVDFFEVSGQFRRAGLGSRSMDLVSQHFRNRRLLAFSEEADGFWATLGWSRYDHREGFPAYRPLFVAPRGWRLR